MRLFGRQSSTWSILIATFLLLILAGAVMLKLPFVKHSFSLSWVDALFTSVSAVCVTGLITVDTSQFNFEGQAIILALFQLGGIGIMTLTSSLILLITGEIGFARKKSIAAISDINSYSELSDVLRLVIFFTIIVEFSGAVLLTAGFMMQGYAPAHALWHGVFHSVSAFCNAGFSTFSDSLIDKGSFVKLVVSALIILGGLGYYVVYDIVMNKNSKRLKIHTKIVLLVSLGLTLSGFIIIKLTDMNSVSLIDSFFQSVTARTAGFNTVDISSLAPASIFIMILLMIIGASPGSTGGGVKTTTIFISIYSILRTVKGRSGVIIFNRKVPNETVMRANAVIMMYFLVISVAVFLLLMTEKQDFVHIVFEVVSAVGTVGLSIGVTPELTVAGKFIIMAAMFTGRVGPTAFLLIMIHNYKQSRVDYIEERLIIG